MTTQRQQILEHLQAYGSITPRQALDLFGSFRLADHVFDLRREHIIHTKMHRAKRDGRSCEYAEYIYERAKTKAEIAGIYQESFTDHRGRA